MAGSAVSSPTSSCPSACSGSRYMVPTSKIPAGSPDAVRRTQDDRGESACTANSMSISSSAGLARRIVRLRTHGRTDLGSSISWAIQASFDRVGIRRAVCPSRGKNRRTAWSLPATTRFRTAGPPRVMLAKPGVRNSRRRTSSVIIVRDSGGYTLGITAAHLDRARPCSRSS